MKKIGKRLEKDWKQIGNIKQKISFVLVVVVVAAKKKISRKPRILLLVRVPK